MKTFRKPAFPGIDREECHSHGTEALVHKRVRLRKNMTSLRPI